MLLSLSTTLLVLLDAIVAVLVIDLALFFVAQNFVGFGYLDKLLVCGFVSTFLC